MHRAEYFHYCSHGRLGRGPILRIAGVSPAMLGACKSPGRYHLTLRSAVLTLKTGSITRRFPSPRKAKGAPAFKHAPLSAIFSLAARTARAIMRLAGRYVQRARGINARRKGGRISS